MQLKLDQLKSVFPSVQDIDSYLEVLNDVLDKYEINTLPRVQQFLAQIAHESAGLTAFVENLNYSRDSLLKVFSKYFTAANVDAYAKQPEKIANRVYANRLGNGNENSGDGWKYRGGGAIQCTGKVNYQLMNKLIGGEDFVEKPELLRALPYSIESACAWWRNSGLNQKADLNTQDGFLAITKAINGGTNGLEDRKNWWNKAKKHITDIEKLLKQDILIEEATEIIIEEEVIIENNTENNEIIISKEEIVIEEITKEEVAAPQKKTLFEKIADFFSNLFKSKK